MTRRPGTAAAAVPATAVAAAALLAVLAACGRAADDVPPAVDAAVLDVVEDRYAPGRPTRLVSPPDPVAVAVLLPGGSWSSAEPDGLRPLAEHLAVRGVAAMTTTYGTDRTGDHHPVPLADAACAVAHAAQAVPDVPVVVVGHSAGAHLALLVGLHPTPEGRCSATPARPAGVVGLAGPYDVSRADGYAENLFGEPLEAAPAAWRDGNPLTWASEQPDVAVLLLHGADDAVVPTSFSDAAADALRAGGHDVAVEVLDGVDHAEVVGPDAVGDLVARWVLDLADE